MNRFFLLFFVLVLFYGNYAAAYRGKKNTPLTLFIQECVHNMVYVNRNIFFSRDTYALLALSAPWYMAGRSVDRPVQNYFYDAHTHRNIHEIAPVFHYSVDPLMGVALATIISLQFLSHDIHIQKVSAVFLASLPFIVLYKNSIKQIPVNASLRPKNEHFSANKKYYGGFPSGHMWQAAFMAYLCGAELGINFAVPLTTFATLVALQSVTINRHTLSQVIAGAALGIVFGVAAQKVVHADLHQSTDYGILLNRFDSLTSYGITCYFEKKF